MTDGVKLEVDWAKTGTWTDESERLRPNTAAVQASYGRDQSTALAPTVSGTGAFALDNRTRRYSPRATTLADGTANPLYSYLKPARPVKVTRTIAGTAYTLFAGHTDDSPINPDVDAKNVSLTLVDSLADFRGQTITTPLYSGIRTGEAIGYILDACGWDADLRDLDAGATIIPWWWENDTDALDALEKVVRSEGPPALLTMSSAGEVVFRDRHHRLTDTTSITSQETWTGDGYGLVMARPFSYDDGWRGIVNTGTASVDVRRPAQPSVVWTSDTTISLSAGESTTVIASASDPFYSATEPVDGTDFTTVAGSVEVTLLRSSGASVSILITAVGGAAVISDLQLRARSVPVTHTVQVSVSDSVSIEDYGPRSLPGDLPWCSALSALAVLSAAVAQRAQPLPVVKARFAVNNDTTKVSVLTRDLSQRVTVQEDETVLDDDFFIESIDHTSTGPLDHSVTFGLEAVPTQPTPLFRFDTTGAGFNDGLFSNGLDEAATMFRFDTSGQGFNDGVFAT